MVQGADRGKHLGFLTANLDIPPEALPRSGVYAVWARIKGEEHWRPGAANIGVNPTFGEKTKKLEVHLLDYCGHLCGKSLEVAPVAYLRPEKRYKTTKELIHQMRKDCQRAAELLSKVQPPISG